MFLWMMVQILIESLPISSSGHVQLIHFLYEYMGYALDVQQTEMIDFLLHGPALIIMLCYFFTTWWKMVVRKDFAVAQLSDLATYRSMINPIIFVLCAETVTVAWWFSGMAHFDVVPLSLLMVGFCITAGMLYATRYFGFNQIKPISGQKNIAWNVRDALILGFAQGFALLPGVSRFATTFCAGRWLGYRSSDAFALSFLIQCPLVLAAFAKAIITISTYPVILAHLFDFSMLSGIVGMTFVSYQLLCFVGSLIQHNRLWYFAYYMILPIMITA